MSPAGKRTVFIHDNHCKDSKATANMSFFMNDVVPHLHQKYHLLSTSNCSLCLSPEQDEMHHLSSFCQNPIIGI